MSFGRQAGHLGRLDRGGGNRAVMKKMSCIQQGVIYMKLSTLVLNPEDLVMRSALLCSRKTLPEIIFHYFPSN